MASLQAPLHDRVLAPCHNAKFYNMFPDGDSFNIYFALGVDT